MKTAECRPAVEHAVLWNNSVLGEEPIRRHYIERVGDEIIARTVLRMFSLGKNRLNLHVKIFSSVLTLQKRWSFTTKEVLFYYKRPPLLYLPLRGKFPTHRSFCFPMRFSQAYRPHVQGRKQRNRGKVCRFDNGKGFCPKVSARQLRFHCMNSEEDMETNTPHYFQSVLAGTFFTLFTFFIISFLSQALPVNDFQSL